MIGFDADPCAGEAWAPETANGTSATKPSKTSKPKTRRFFNTTPADWHFDNNPGPQSTQTPGKHNPSLPNVPRGRDTAFNPGGCVITTIGRSFAPTSEPPALRPI